MEKSSQTTRLLIFLSDFGFFFDEVISIATKKRVANVKSVMQQSLREQNAAGLLTYIIWISLSVKFDSRQQTAAGGESFSPRLLFSLSAGGTVHLKLSKGCNLPPYYLCGKFSHSTFNMMLNSALRKAFLAYLSKNGGLNLRLNFNGS